MYRVRNFAKMLLRVFTKSYSRRERHLGSLKKENRSWQYLSNELAAPALIPVVALTIASMLPRAPFAPNAAK